MTVNLIELPKMPELTKLSLSWIKAKVENKPSQQYFDVDELKVFDAR